MGFDRTLITSDIDDEMVCGICADMLLNPMMVCEEGHSLCEECIKQWQGQNKTTCPMCRKSLNGTFIINRPLANMIGRVVVKCSNERKGHKRVKRDEDVKAVPVTEQCSWTGKLNELKVHQTLCAYRLHPCPNAGCRDEFNINQLTEHSDELCKFRTVKCSHCPNQLQFRLLHNHEQTCNQRPVTCSNAGCTHTCKAVNLVVHKRSCGFQVIPCAFPGAACDMVVRRQDMESHFKNDSYKHVMVMQRLIQHQAGIIQNQANTIEELKREQALCQKAQTSVEKTLTKMKTDTTSQIDAYRNDIKNNAAAIQNNVGQIASNRVKVQTNEGRIRNTLSVVQMLNTMEFQIYIPEAEAKSQDCENLSMQAINHGITWKVYIQENGEGKLCVWLEMLKGYSITLGGAKVYIGDTEIKSHDDISIGYGSREDRWKFCLRVLTKAHIKSLFKPNALLRVAVTTFKN